MSDFLSEFDEQGRYRKSDAVLDVTFVTTQGQYAGELDFKRGNLVRAEMDGASNCAFPDNAPLDGVRFHLLSAGDVPVEILVDQGRLRHRRENKPGDVRVRLAIEHKTA